MNILSSRSNGVAKEIRGFLGSVLIFGFICSIIVLLIQFPVLETNKEVVMLLLGSVGASIPLIISSITGTKKDDLEALKLALEKKELQIDLLVKAKDNLEEMVINLQKEMLQNQDMMLDRILLKNAMDFDDKHNPPKNK
tara:strand:+ start:39 stop:455 length:417 start_codon:yes stop_codon:yes gene_type:complete